MAANAKDPTQWATIGKLIGALVAAGVLAAGVLLPYVGGLGMLAGHEAEKFQNTACNLQESKPPQRTTFYASDRKTVIARIFDQNRVLVPLNGIPVYLRQALIATEDRRFFAHHGVDMRGLIRSAVSTSGGDTQGGSTLTMQYVKQERYFQAGNNKAKQDAAISQNLNRKIEDAKCALYIENTLHESKQQILDNYLNIAFFGENAYGIQIAAETYFGKSASRLSLGESALLVGLLRAPTSYDPFQHLAAARQRRNEVIQNLVSVGQLSQAAADREKATPIVLAGHGPPTVREGCIGSKSTIVNASFFCQYAEDWLTSQGGLTATQLETGGYDIVTTLNASLQSGVQKRIDSQLPAGSPTTAVMPVLDPKTGDVLAMATSKTLGGKHGQTYQPVFTGYTGFGASTYKLFPLLAALGTGFPDTWELETAGSTGTYVAKNCTTAGSATNGDANESYDLNSTLAQATATSDNTFFVGLADQGFDCQLEGMVTLARNLGMKGLDQPADPGNRHSQTIAQSIVEYQRAQQFVLGSVPTSPMEITAAYAAVADDGYYHPPTPIESITDSSGKSVPVKREAGSQVVSPQVARQAMQILKLDTIDNGTSAVPFSRWYTANSSPIAGKTGTAQANPTTKNGAIWFVGMTPNLVATTALIDFDRSSAPLVLPGKDAGSAYGAFASNLWLRALQPALVRQHWIWQDPAQVAGSGVPPLTGLTLSDARNTLQDDNFKMALAGPAGQTFCPSSVAYGNVAYYAPTIARPGATITVCQSSQTPQPIYTAPPPVTHEGNGQHNGSGNGSGNGGGNGSGGNGSGGSGNGGGNGSGSGGSGSGGSGSGGSGNGGSGGSGGSGASGNGGNGGGPLGGIIPGR